MITIDIEQQIDICNMCVSMARLEFITSVQIALTYDQLFPKTIKSSKKRILCSFNILYRYSPNYISHIISMSLEQTHFYRSALTTTTKK